MADMTAVTISIKERKYRELVQHKTKKLSEDDLSAGVRVEWSELPATINHDQPPKSELFYTVVGVLMEAFGDPSFWQRATCAEAWALIVDSLRQPLSLDSALEESKSAQLPLADIASAPKADQDALVGLFELTTDLMAHLASTSKTARQNMGIKKGLFG